VKKKSTILASPFENKGEFHFRVTELFGMGLLCDIPPALSGPHPTIFVLLLK